MDLTIPLEKVTLNIRTAVLFRTSKGYVLEKHLQGYCFPVGGRVKQGESSLEAAKRELFEELGVRIEKLALRAIVENFFDNGDRRVHEICFVYGVDYPEALELGGDLGAYPLEEIEAIDFRPRIVKEVLQAADDTVLHLIYKE